MEFSSLIFPSKNICRTCLVETETTMFMNIQDLVEYEMNQVKLIDILVFLHCLENNDEENWPQGMCSICVSTALTAYSFKLNCLKANDALSQILNIPSSPPNIPRSDIDAIDINVVYQDHEYDVPLFSNPNPLEFGPPENKELIPLPSVSEITFTEPPQRKEGEKKYACTICSKSFTRIYGLKYHMAKHTGTKKHLCFQCGKTFHTSGGVKKHLLSHKNVSQFKCGFCNKAYKSRQYLKEHFRVAHSSNRYDFVCVTCGKSFTAKSTLMMHSKIHSGEKPFACTECPKRFTRAIYLRAHSLVHKGQERPKTFHCKQLGCNRNFATKYTLSVHTAYAHSSERPHKCEICLKGFATASGLKVHKECHAGKEYVCNVCGKKMTSKRVLQKHVKVHDVDANNMILETVVDDVFFDGIY